MRVDQVVLTLVLFGCTGVTVAGEPTVGSLIGLESKQTQLQMQSQMLRKKLQVLQLQQEIKKEQQALESSPGSTGGIQLQSEDCFAGKWQATVKIRGVKYVVSPNETVAGYHVVWIKAGALREVHAGRARTVLMAKATEPSTTGTSPEAISALPLPPPPTPLSANGVPGRP